MSRKASGFKAWVVQRASAVYLAGYILYLLIYFSVAPPLNFQTWHIWLSGPVNGIFMALFFLSLLLHAWIGVRDVVMDYIHPLEVRLTVLTGIALLLAGCGFWVLRTLIMVAL